MGRSGGIGATVSVRGFSRPWGGSWVDSKDDPAVRRAVPDVTDAELRYRSIPALCASAHVEGNSLFRGAKPRWLVAAMKEGKKLEDFAIEKNARKRRAKQR
jgi:hypothetical protein